MRFSDIVDFVQNRISGTELSGYLDAEVQQHLSLCAKRGASAPVHVSDPNEIIEVDDRFVGRLCESVANGELSSDLVGYIADGLLLSEGTRFSSESVREALEKLTD